MPQITYAEIHSLAKYQQKRQEIQNEIFPIKENRRIAVGPMFCFLFENKKTLIYQIQEMIHIEKITDKQAIEHEIQTYNALLAPRCALSATLLIQIEDKEVRKIKLKELLGIEKHVYLEYALGSTKENIRIQAQFDKEQYNTERISSVQFIRFVFSDKETNQFIESTSVSLSIDHPYYNHSVTLETQYLEALKKDIVS